MHTIPTPNTGSHQLPLAELAAAIEAMIALYDAALGDPNIELNGDENDSDGDERGDTAWIEWNTMRGSQKSGHNLLAGEEDAEDDEGGGDHGGDEGEPDFAKRAGGYRRADASVMATAARTHLSSNLYLVREGATVPPGNQ